MAPPDKQGAPSAPPYQPLTIGVVRFALELFAIGGLAWWGWRLGDGGVMGAVLAILIPAIAFAIWGTFAVRDDPSRNPNPPVAIPGWLRVVIEFAVYGLAAYGLWTNGGRAWAETLLTGVGLTYVVSYDRLLWLLRQR